MTSQPPKSTPPAEKSSAGGFLSSKHREWIAGYLFVLPDALGLLIFVGLPMVLSLTLGFYKVDGFGGFEWVGFSNYLRLFSDLQFLHSLRVTLAYSVLVVPGLYIAGLGLALLVQSGSRLSAIFRALFFLPQVVSLVVVAVVWQVLLVDKIGIISKLTAAVGLGGISWIGDPSWALFTTAAVSIWFMMGFYMIIFLGGLQDIPKEYYEAASMDGSGPVKSFIYITLPLLQPTSFFVLLVSLVAAVAGGAVFDLVFVLTSGGPANATSLTILYIYQRAFVFNEFGYSAAMATFLVVVLMAFTILLFRLSGGGRFSND